MASARTMDQIAGAETDLRANVHRSPHAAPWASHHPRPSEGPFAPRCVCAPNAVSFRAPSCSCPAPIYLRRLRKEPFFFSVAGPPSPIGEVYSLHGDVVPFCFGSAVKLILLLSCWLLLRSALLCSAHSCPSTSSSPGLSEHPFDDYCALSEASGIHFLCHSFPPFLEPCPSFIIYFPYAPLKSRHPSR